MAKKRKISVTTKSQGVKITHPDTAGIDVGKTIMQVSVPEDRCPDSNRSFGTYTRDLDSIVDWLRGCGIRRVVMESTGIYWIPLFLKLEEAGFEAILVNARDVRNMSGRKSDVNDADWLRFLGSCDLIRPCFQIAAVSRRLREFHRLRAGKIKDMARELQHMQKAMEKMNVKLDGVLSDIAGKSGTAIIDAILAGQRDPEALASLADPGCRKSREEIALALHGTWDMEHPLALRMAVDTYRHLKSQVTAIDGETEAFLDSYRLSDLSVTPEDLEDKRSGKRDAYKNPVEFDVEMYSFLMYGVNLKCIPGFGEGTLMVLMSELGPDFISKFRTPARFCRWCNLTPVDTVTGGRLTGSKVPRNRPNPVGQALRQAAATLRKGDSPLGRFKLRMRSRLGPAQAVVATAHKMAELVFLLVGRQVEYDPSRSTVNETEMMEKRIRHMEAKLSKLKDSVKKLSDS